MCKTYRVYGIFNKKTGECVYIGQTGNSIRSRWYTHTWWKAEWSQTKINVYMRQNGGYENFEIVCLIEGYSTRQEALEWESHYILENNPRCNIRW